MAIFEFLNVANKSFGVKKDLYISKMLTESSRIQTISLCVFFLWNDEFAIQSSNALFVGTTKLAKTFC